ncbi:hypothetical protein CVU37_10970 [candidate division BRC1 bacterium HGW-BRC1-1]|nr:MAG: hypothetical protein CVU37_10970 [candidate division BRC1 bacterium HGW-BRC1-1]
MTRIFASLAVSALLVTAAFAAQPTFTLNNNINYQPAPNLGNAYPMVSRPAGGVVFADGYDDAIARVATPLTSDGATDNAANSWDVNSNTDLARGFNSGESFQGITYDGANYFAVGVLATGANLWMFTDSGSESTRWAGSKITVSPDAPYSGVTAVAVNSLVMCDQETGSLQFFLVSGGSAAAVGSPIANPGATGLKTTCVVYYNGPGQDYFFTYLASDTLTRRIDVFTTDGTPAGTAHAGTLCTGVVSNMPVAGHYNQKWSTINVDPAKQLLVAASNEADAATANGFDAFNLSTVVTNGTATPYVQNRDATTFGAKPGAAITGMAFFKVASVDYLAVNYSNQLAVFTMATAAAVSDWTLY